MNPEAPQPSLLMACLCAAWCDTCRDYVAVFAACAAEFGARVQPLWVDIEDNAELIDCLDVENFPTLLLARDDTLLFLGPITPQAQTLSRLVTGALDGDLKPPAFREDVAGLPARLRAWRGSAPQAATSLDAPIRENSPAPASNGRSP